ncbi:MAG: hypothetical protein R2744_07275 [Bacteroidales bacterium]
MAELHSMRRDNECIDQFPARTPPHFTHRLHYVIVQGRGGSQCGAGKAVWYVRNTDERIEDMYNRGGRLCKAAAMATRTTLEEIRF